MNNPPPNSIFLRTLFAVLLWAILGIGAENGKFYFDPGTIHMMIKINGAVVLLLLPIISYFPWWKPANHHLWFCYLLMVFTTIISVCMYNTGHYGFATSGVMISGGLLSVGFVKFMDDNTELD